MRRVTVLTVALVRALAPAHAGAAPAAPPGKPALPPGTLAVRPDLDGDGAPDTCTLTPGGQLTVVAASGARLYERKMPAAPPGKARLHVHQVRPGGTEQPVPVVEARVPLAKPAGAEEVIVLGGRPFREICADRVGPVGRDAEWSRHLAVSAEAVLRFQRATHVTRCDGAPTFLYPQVYDFKAGRFAPQGPAAPPPAPRRVTAQRQPPAGAPSGPPLSRFFVSGASSVVNDEGSAANLAPPLGLTDGKLETAWVEGAARGGRGQFVTLRGSPGPFRVKALRIVPGHGHSAAAYRHYDRLHRALLIFDRATVVGVDFPQEVAGPGGHGVAYWVVLPGPVATGCVTMLVESTFPGRAAATPTGGRVAVAELTVYSEADFGVRLPEIIDRLVTDLASGAGGEAVRRLVAQQGAAAERPLLAALGSASGAGRALVVETLAEVATPAAAGALGRALDAGEREHRAAARALHRLGAAAVPALAEILADAGAPPGLRVRVAAQLGRIGGEAAARALLGSLPGAPDDLRNAVAEALRDRPGSAALALAVGQLANAGAARHRADLLRAVAVTAAAAGAE
ncbi:MAG: hypothetical protein HY906_11995, partial [Deltaproteobacteria bacterium]|nr:hypothetical protein [Deltaproteobacteria bacterium]